MSNSQRGRKSLHRSDSVRALAAIERRFQHFLRFSSLREGNSSHQPDRLFQ